MTNIEDVADSPGFVIPIYILVLIPLGLYIYHDIVDKRWRTIRRIKLFLVCYLLLYTSTASALIAYIFIQAKASDFKEVGAAVLALVIGSYKLWTLIRLIFIIHAHRQIVELMTECDKALQKLLRCEISEGQADTPRSSQVSSSIFEDDSPEASSMIEWMAKKMQELLRREVSEDQADTHGSSQTSSGLLYLSDDDHPGDSSWIKRIAKKAKELWHREVPEDQDGTYRSSKISSSLFDDDYPGDSSRIRWIAKKVTVHQDDQKEFIARLAIWMRVACFPGHNSIWDLLRNLDPVQKGARMDFSLANTLKFMPVAIRPRATQNPAEILLNAKELLKYAKERNKSEQDASHIRLNIWHCFDRKDAVVSSVRKFSKLGAALFWSVADLREEEISQIIADMPATWLADTSLSGKELIYDLAIIMVLVDIPPCANRFGNSLKEILGLKCTEIKNETLDYNEDMWNHIWDWIFDVCGESVATVMAAYYPDEHRDETKTCTHNETKKWLKALLTMLEKDETLGTARLGAHLLYMIREAYYAACVTLNVLGKDLDESSATEAGKTNQLIRDDQHTRECVKALYQVDIVLGLLSLLASMPSTSTIGKCIDVYTNINVCELLISHVSEDPYHTLAHLRFRLERRGFFTLKELLAGLHFPAAAFASVVHLALRGIALEGIASEVNVENPSGEIENEKRMRCLYGKERASYYRRTEEHTLLQSELQQYQSEKKKQTEKEKQTEKKFDSAWELSWLDPATEPTTPSP